MALRTDLALESAQSISKKGSLPDGIKCEVTRLGDFDITDVVISTTEAAKRIGKPKGRYLTLEPKRRLDLASETLPKDAKHLAKAIRTLIGEDTESVLVVGLGNDEITPDSLGASVAKRIFASRHINLNAPELSRGSLSDVSVIATSVMGKTGIESSDIVKAVCDRIKPSCVIAIDALACSDISHLGRTIQLTDTGISPGSGVANSRRELSISTLGIKCIALGIPTICDLKSGSDLMVTPRTIDKIIQNSASLLASGINFALHKGLSEKELEILTS